MVKAGHYDVCNFHRVYKGYYIQLGVISPGYVLKTSRELSIRGSNVLNNEFNSTLCSYWAAQKKPTSHHSIFPFNTLDNDFFS